MKLIANLADYNNTRSLANRFRNNRFKFFEERVKKLNFPIKILDIGGTTSFWVNRGFHNSENFNIILLNLHKERSDYSNIESIVGDATNLSMFKEDEFDLIFSNSVIEHLFSKENQGSMAREVNRVGRFHFIQTPNRNFFIEPHFLLPFFHFLPFRVQLFILTKTRLSRGRSRTQTESIDKLNEINLLGTKEMKDLFPNSKFYNEKFLGMVKSITAYNLPD